MTPILLLLLATLTAQAATFTGKVVGVSDGDTITVLAAGNKQFKIRLLAIDTPESGNKPVAKPKPPTKPLPATPPGVVYIAETGKKYHTAGCQHLKKSRIAIALVKARRSHTPCSKCFPPR